jgi:hypothetical protein
MHDGGGGGFGGHASGDIGLTSHRTPARHRADGRFTPWNGTPVGHESFRLRRGGGPGGNPVIFWVILAVVAIAVVMVFAAH